MVGIVGIIASLTVLGLSLIITRIATTALSLTGLSWEAARFQARSAFTGTGFTTTEAERVVDHPVRALVHIVHFVHSVHTETERKPNDECRALEAGKTLPPV
jgi:hypothetical protein